MTIWSRFGWRVVRVSVPWPPRHTIGSEILKALRLRGAAATLDEILGELTQTGRQIDAAALREAVGDLYREGRVRHVGEGKWAVSAPAIAGSEHPLFDPLPPPSRTIGNPPKPVGPAKTALPTWVVAPPDRDPSPGPSLPTVPPTATIGSTRLAPTVPPTRTLAPDVEAPRAPAVSIVRPGGAAGADPKSGRGGPSPASTSELPSGSVLRGRYRIRGVIGEGGMGRVYEAEDLELRRVVALKTIGSTAPHAIDALKNELTLLSTIDRPDYFPRVYEGFEDSGAFYVPMDRIDGQDLSKFLGEVPVAELDVATVDRIFEAICHRLHYLHEFPSHQILFRDLKPSNVMVVGSTLEVRLVDFGIAAKVDAARAIRAGTPGFWAPEARSHGRYSVRSDVYALGQLLRCLLWAQPAPPDGDEPIPFAKDRGLPPELDAVARKMADRRPDRRPASALLALDSFRRACVAAASESARSAAHQSCPECGFASLGEFNICAACGRWLQTPEESPVALDDWPRIRRRLLDMSRQVATDKSNLNRSSHRELLESAAALGRTPGYRELTCLPSIRVEAYPYQRRAALKVLRDFQGRAILADEVGLGKTIEAGLILKEYWVRGEARRALIIVPPALREQWKNELLEKFAFRPEEVLTFGPDGDTTDLSCLDSPRIALIASHQRARQSLREDLLRRSWDVLIVDEAHHAKRQSKTKMNRLAELLDKVNCRRSIFLTATPAQNDLRELFYLVSLVRPGLVGADAWQFSQRFGGIHGAWAVRAKDELGALLQRVVVRNRRDEVLRAFPTRVARTFQIALAPAEASAYRSLVSAAQQADVNPLALVDRTRQFCTSYQSLLSGESAGSLTEELRKLAGTPHFKLRAFLEQVLPSLAEETKVLIFSRYRASQREINDALVQAGQVSMLAGDSPFERAKSVRRFKTDPSLRFLVCGEALSEGVNLQFCRCMINFDLPWNPQRIEQRIGRIQRLGSPHREVLVVNLAAKGTIEDLVIDYVEKKLKMFEDVFGSVEAVLGQLAEGESIEGFIREALRRGREGQYDPNVAKRGGESIESAREAANAEDGLAGILGLFDGLGTSSETDDAGEDVSEDEGESDRENDGYAGVEA